MKPKKSKKRKYIKVKFFLTIFALTIIFLFTVKYYESKVMPTVKKTMEHYGIITATKIIDKSVKAVIDNAGVTSEDLYIKTTDKNGKIMSFSADTVLINSLCTSVSDGVLEGLSAFESESVYLPVGIVSGVEFLSARGPEIFKIEFQPLGECNVEYKTSFASEGINQVNFQIWLDIKTAVMVVNPLSEHKVTVVRQVPIVNTYISGEVPESMLYPFGTKADI